MSRLAGRYPESAAYLGESLRLCQDAADDYGAAVVLDSCGDLARSMGDGDRAAAAYRESLATRLQLPDPVGAATCLEGLGAVGWMRGDVERAARLYGAAASLRARLRAPRPRAYSAEHERIRAELQRAMGLSRFAAASSAGGALSLADAARKLADLA